MKPEWRSYLLYFRRAWPLALVGLAGALGKGAALAILALQLRNFLAAIGADGSLTRNWRFVMFAVLAAAASSILAFVASEATARMTKPVISRLRRELVEKMLRLSPQRLHEISRGHLHSIVVRDVERIDLMTYTLVGLVLPAFVSALMLTGLLVRKSPMFGLGCIVITAAIWILSRYLRRKVVPWIRRFHDAGAEFSRGALLTLERYDLARAFAAERHEMAQRDQQIDHLERAGRQSAWRIQSVGETHAALNNFALIGFVMGGALAVHARNGSYDLMTVFLILMLMRAQASIIVAGLPDIDAGALALERVWMLLGIDEPALYQGSQIHDFQGAIRLDRVTFGYGDTPLLKAVSLAVGPGECVAICGANGAGKTTIINLILGLLRPQSGRLSVDGHAYDDIDLDRLRRSVGFVPQSAGLFPGTVAENIAYAMPDATAEQIAGAARLAGASDFIEALAEGYQNRIGEDGALLSGGQGQRIALARALLCRPRLLILDEPTNHLDAEAIAHLLNTLRTLPERPGILLISHAEDVLDAADAVFVLADGTLQPAMRDRQTTRQARAAGV